MDNEIYGWVGKILCIDLSSRKISEQPTMDYAKDFMGGMGVGLKILWDENPANVDPLDAENRITFFTGPLTGTLAPTSGRMEICTKAAGTEPPMCTRSGVGGTWGPELKFSGYDGVIIKGKAEKPVYIWIHDGEVEILDASKLWGLDTFTVQKEIQQLHGKEVRVLCIGQAGENLVRLSTISTETGYAAAKIGGGAVMGAKNLKAVAVKGSGGIKIARVDEFLEVARQGWELTHAHPVRDWSTEGPYHRIIEYTRKYRTKYVSCFGCPVNCRNWIEFPGLQPGEAMCAGGWWYQIIGSRDEKAIWEGRLLADQYGLCAHTVLDLIRWLMEVYKGGLITEEETGIPWSKFGSSEFIAIFLRKIAFREGFGDILADGPARAAQRLGPEISKNFALYFPAYGQGEHYEPRAYPMYLMQWAFDSRDPLTDAHDWSTTLNWETFSWPESQAGHHTLEEAKAIGKKYYGSEEAFNPYSYDYKAEALVFLQNRSRLKNSLVLCDWIFPVFGSPNNPPHFEGDGNIERKLFCAATGIDMDEAEWYRTGERIYNLERALLVRDNHRSRQDDTIGEYWFKVPVTRLPRSEPPIDPPPTCDHEKFEKAKDTFYKLRGWDIATGRPTKRKLEELGLKDVANELGRLKLLP